ncbi:MAG TPA: transketolase, partial [Patescibacteria group bacterium]|nr:transketolase [Patescibacteria group bacterium]
RSALKKSQAEKSKPTLIIGNTTMGKGALDASGKSFEHQVSTHGMPLSGAGGSYEKTIKNLGGDPKDPFVIPDEVKKLYDDAAQNKTQSVNRKKKAEQDWRKDNLDKAQQLDFYLSGQPPRLDWEAVAKAQKPGIATRTSSSYVLGEFAEHIGNMIVMSADLANSDKTDGFLKKSKPLAADDFSGGFLHCGVSEFTMAALAIGMSLHGGVIPVCGTFFAFSDYMKPALRLAALMEVPVKFLWTHDAFRVGEDGPTHQPIEQEAQLRLLEKVHNHSGKPGLLALRPADSAETTVAWKLAIENTSTPTGLILTRQNVPDVVDYRTAVNGSKGAYIAYEPKKTPELMIIANGSEVGTAYEAIKLLPKHNIRLVSVPSEGLFREQPKSYQDSILLKNIPRFGVTAGLAVNLLGLVGDIDRIHSLEHFGFSAPYEKLDEEFGFTPERLADKIQKLL